MLEMLRSRNRVVWPAVTTVVALVLFLSTLQADVSASHHPYAADVGEIQNAFPRWGLIHYSGYPLYTAVGSLFTNALWLIGIEPAAGASLFSTVWGAVSIELTPDLEAQLRNNDKASSHHGKSSWKQPFQRDEAPARLSYEVTINLSRSKTAPRGLAKPAPG